MWHRDLPDDSKPDAMDIIAKALMIRLGGSVTLTEDELRGAGSHQAEINMMDDGSLSFRIERQ
jgi:hypothetical protein